MNEKTLQIALKACGNSQTELANRLGVSRQVVWAWCKKKDVPQWRVAALLMVIADKRRA